MSGSEVSGSAAPGWYRDPWAQRSQRYWDGLAWTAFVRDGQTVPGVPPPSPAQPSFASAAAPADGVAPCVRTVAKAQKLVLLAIALYIAVLVMRAVFILVGTDTVIVYAVASLVPLIALAALVMALIGVYQLTVAFDYSMAVRVLCLVLMFVPPAGLVMLAILNSRATSLLRAAGLKVGLLGFHG